MSCIIPISIILIYPTLHSLWLRILKIQSPMFSKYCDSPFPLLTGPAFPRPDYIPFWLSLFVVWWPRDKVWVDLKGKMVHIVLWDKGFWIVFQAKKEWKLSMGRIEPLIQNQIVQKNPEFQSSVCVSSDVPITSLRISLLPNQGLTLA